MRRAINRQTQTNTPGWERGVIWVMSMFMMLDSSITAVQAEWHAGFIIIIINSVIVTSCNHIIIHALTQPCMRSNEACCPLRENIIERTLEQWGRAARLEAWVFNTAHFNVDSWSKSVSFTWNIQKQKLTLFFCHMFTFSCQNHITLQRYQSQNVSFS